MRLRIIAGQHGGRVIDAPPTRKTHPMSERARNAIFNSLGDDIIDTEVLDAFAGSGALGLEALSRGAASAVFIDKNRVATKVITESVDKLGLADKAKVVCAGVSAWLGNNPDRRFDVIFADPPYHDLQTSTVRSLSKHLSPGGTLVLSWPSADQPPEIDGLDVHRQRSYAGAQIVFYRHL